MDGFSTLSLRRKKDSKTKTLGFTYIVMPGVFFVSQFVDRIS